MIVMYEVKGVWELLLEHCVRMRSGHKVACFGHRCYSSMLMQNAVSVIKMGV